MPMPNPWVEKARAYTAATRRNQAMAPVQGISPQGAEFAGKISDLYMGLRSSAEDVADDARLRMATDRSNLLGQFGEVDKNIQSARANSSNYLSAVARQLGLTDALQGPGVETADQQFDQLNTLNNANRTNQLASYDLLRGTYGEMLNRGWLNYDNLAAEQLGNLYNTIAALQPPPGSGGGGGGGGGFGGGGRSGGGGRGRSSRGRSSRGGGSGGSGGFGGTDYLPESSTFIAINPYNPPSGSTYSADYVRPEVRGGRAPVPVRKIKKKVTTSGGGGGRHFR